MPKSAAKVDYLLRIKVSLMRILVELEVVSIQPIQTGQAIASFFASTQEPASTRVASPKPSRSQVRARDRVSTNAGNAPPHLQAEPGNS